MCEYRIVDFELTIESDQETSRMLNRISEILTQGYKLRNFVEKEKEKDCAAHTREPTHIMKKRMLKAISSLGTYESRCIVRLTLGIQY